MCILLLYLTYGYNRLSKDAFRASLAMFSKPARQHVLPRVSNETELDNYTGRKQAAETAETHYITAESQEPTLRVGSVISLYSSFLERVGNLSEESLGNFIIIEITHEVSQGSYYKNRFKAIPATIKALPSPKVRMPLAETQMATVLSNADPDGKGRVRVRMNWQTDGMQTGWVRVMTPDGGSSSDVKSNRGFVFIPEVGDQVLLGFRHGDPARPYVLGSLFNGTTGRGGLEGNHMKSLTTRSGHTIKLNDSLSSLGITIKDIKGNSIHIDSVGDDIIINAKRNITINAGETFTVNAREMEVNIDGDIIEKIGKNKISTIGNKISLEAMEKEEEITENTNINIGGHLTQEVGDIVLETFSGDAIIIAEGKALLQGKDDARISKG